MVYDRWDRLVLTQDAKLRPNHNWVYTKYDEHDRPVVTGFHHDPYNTSLPQIVAFLKQGETWQTRYESRTSSGLGYTVTQTHPYTAESSALTVTYYDDYSWTNSVPPAFRTY